MRRLALLLAVAIAAAACGFSLDDTSPTPLDRSVSQGGPGKPTIRIVSPKHGDTVRTGKYKEMPVVVEVDNFALVDRVGKKKVSGEGHIIYYRIESPNARLPTDSDETALTGGEGVFTAYPSHKTTYGWPLMPSKRIPAGNYGFAVQLVNSDNTPLATPQWAVIGVNVQA